MKLKDMLMCFQWCGVPWHNGKTCYIVTSCHLKSSQMLKHPMEHCLESCDVIDVLKDNDIV